jgi:hypothetical protein
MVNLAKSSLLNNDLEVFLLLLSGNLLSRDNAYFLMRTEFRKYRSLSDLSKMKI